MLNEHDYPILEFDSNPTAKLNPTAFAGEPLCSDKMIITFFPEVMDKLKEEGRIAPEVTLGGENPTELYRFTEENILITLGAVGCPSCAGNLDLFHAMGVNKVMFCGGGGVLDRNIAVGQLLLVDSAIRDEGFSYHYIEPSRYIDADPRVNAKIAGYLEAHDVPYLRGRVWTTDALFRETQDRIDRRRAEGAKIVEMEQAGCLAVAKFRGFAYGALIYGGDDMTGEEWDKRGWRSRKGVRYDLVSLCRELVKIL